MIINHNLSSMFASRQANINADNVQSSMEKLSSGLAINSAKDNASGLAVSEKMRSQIRGLNMASKNIQDANSLVSVTESSLQETTDVLQRIRELSVQAGNSVYSDEDRHMIQTEVSQLVQEIDRIASTAQFNGMNLLTGRFAETGITFHVGANVDQNISVKIGSMDAKSLGLKDSQGTENSISVDSPEKANMTIATIDEALKKVSQQRAELGATSNRMDMAKKGVDTYAENLQASESRIRDADMAKEMVEFTKNQVLQSASVAMLAQANSNSQNVLQLLK